MQLCSKPWGAHGIEPETFRRRGHVLGSLVKSGALSKPKSQLWIRSLELMSLLFSGAFGPLPKGISW